MWDDDEEEEEEDDEDEQERLAQLEQRRRNEWLTSTYEPIQTQLDDFWKTHHAPTEPTPDPRVANNNNAAQSTTTETETTTDGLEASSPPALDISWMDYYMPPYHPQSLLSVPSSHDEDGYWPVATSNTADDERVLDRMRRMLEECSACQGLMLCQGSKGWSAGMADGRLLPFWADECPSARRMVVSWHDDNQDSAPPSTGEWVRHAVEQAWALHQCQELAHAVLPLELPKATASVVSQFQGTAWAAAALECATLPFRLRPNHGSRIALQSGYTAGFGEASSISFAEFLNQLLPSSKHMVLELDVMLPQQQTPKQSLARRLQQGTSVERDTRMRSRTTVTEELPGSWMSSADSGGVLTSLSPLSRTDHDDRSLHRHFSLSAAVRTSNDTTLSTNQYLSSLMEGMGPRFHPEQSMATVLDQSLGQLTTNGYAAGSYWKSAVWNKNAKHDDSVLAVLGNTTRRYAHLQQTAADLKRALSPKLRGFYNRHVMQGLLPEGEDCQEALESCLDLRDTYMPPQGSGLGNHYGDSAYVDDL